MRKSEPYRTKDLIEVLRKLPSSIEVDVMDVWLKYEVIARPSEALNIIYSTESRHDIVLFKPVDEHKVEIAIPAQNVYIVAREMKEGSRKLPKDIIP